MKLKTKFQSNPLKARPLFICLILVQILVKLAQCKQLNDSKNQQQQINRSKNERLNVIEGDENGLYLVGLFDIHQSNPRVPFKCGQIDADAGEWHSRRPMQNMEAFLWAIEQVNEDKSLLPGIKLGSLIMDTCSSFLRTSQQFANLLHGHQASQGPQQAGKASTPSARQIMAVVADNADWQSVEAVVSMASALSLTTFVTQSKSTKLIDFARKYRPTSNQLEQNASPIRLNPQTQMGPPLASSLNVDYSQDLQRRSLGDLQTQHHFDSLLGELLGVGKMTASPLQADDSRPAPVPVDNLTLPIEEHLQPQKLYLVKMLLGNEMLADALASLVQYMNWDLISIVYDDELDMVDLHDELVRQLFSRNSQLALDHQINVGSPTEAYDRLLQSLAQKTLIGARVVITLLGTGSSRFLLDSLRHLRNSPNPNKERVRQVNSLLWITVTDREPYYSFATDALGTIAISSSVSLPAEFKNYYDKLANEQHGLTNKWWPEYMRTILIKHRRNIELVSSECAKWQEPNRSPLQDKCKSLSLSSLVQIGKQSEVNRTQQGANVATTVGGNLAARQFTASKLSKYLAGGWEHNGIDVINSVLAVANSLESTRQVLCPGTQVGLCDRMRELISPGQSNGVQAGTLGLDQVNPNRELPTLSELMYNEMLRSTFQLADGRMFNLEDFNSQGGQVEGKLKLYNLRYLQPNSIGFVKFGTFDQQDGLSLNSSKARHYPSSPANSDQVTIGQVKSSCQDESKCLMLSSYAGLLNKQAMSEEELAVGVNSLFKLDHPLISSPGQGFPLNTIGNSQANSGLATQLNGFGLSGGDQGRQRTGGGEELDRRQSAQTIGRQVVEDSHIHTIRSPPAMGGQFNWSTTATGAVYPAYERRATFNTIVLLPLHKGYQSSWSAFQPSQVRCSESLNLESSFQHLVAIAYAQNLVNSIGNNREPILTPKLLEMGEQQQQIELTTTVIDYCDSLELAQQKLMAKLSEQSNSTGTTSSPTEGDRKVKTVAVIDFDGRISEQIDKISSEHNLLHLTVGSSLIGAQSRQAHKSPMSFSSQKEVGPSKNHLRISLLPSKINEIQALVKLVSSMGQWKLVHLIYTDHHHYRDEFVRLANEANICVSKLIWIPSPIGSSNNESYSMGTGNNGNKGQTNGQFLSPERSEQFEKTKRIFAQELHDYSSSISIVDRKETGSQGLNSTRVLVILASSDHSTNRMILEASSKSMLDDYVWITSHEWLNSVELAAERQASLDGGQQAGGKVNLPRFFVSTRLETFESHGFRHYFSNLSPSIHAPIPTGWFDEFWQQKFHCRLPISGSTASGPAMAKAPVCSSKQRLELHEIVEEDRVSYIVQAIEAIHMALHATGQNITDEMPFPSKQFAANFREAFERLRLQLGPTNQSLPLNQLPYGFNIIHRLLPDGAGEQVDSRRQNSRDLAIWDEQGQLLKVGLWRDGQLILARKNLNESSMLWLNQALNADSADRETVERVARSLNKLGAIRSRCVSHETCMLCRQQVELTNALVKQEEARALQSLSANEPQAVSSIWSSLLHQPAASILHPVLSSPFDDDADEDNEDDNEGDEIGGRPAGGLSKLAQNDRGLVSGQELDGKQSKLSSPARDYIQAAASSLFNSETSKLVEKEQQNDIRRAYGHMMHLHGRLQPPITLNLRQISGLLMSVVSLLGIVCMVVSMTYLYPNMLERKEKGVDCSNLSALNRPLEATLSARESFKPTTGSQLTHQEAYSSLANLNDYFLLTGLLMLNSINLAFLLPATPGVCWFRRIGLATSYTVIFSSILVKVLTNFSQSFRQKKSITTLKDNNVLQGSQFEKSQQQLDSSEENVEVTFESLPHDHSLMNADCQRQQTTCSTIESTQNGYQVADNSSNEQENRLTKSSKLSRFANYCKLSNLLTISIVLIIGQIVVALVWLIRQPPEPTLFLSCWHCSSPIRSPVLFLYEPLISLTCPALILVFAWLWSIVSFRIASKNEENFRATGQALAASEPRANWQLKTNQYQLDDRLREAKSLVITLTLLVLCWSILTLKTISSSHNFLPTINFNSQHSVYSISQSESTKTDDLTLVYANVISGAIIFAFSFIYRLNLFSCFNSIGYPIRFKSRSRASFVSNSLSSSSASTFALTNGTQRDILRYNQNHEVGLNKWLGSAADIGGSHETRTGDSIFAGIQFSTSRGSREERLKLQQFNTYGTYSATSGHEEENCLTSTSTNPLSLHAIASTFSHGNQSHGSRAPYAGKQQQHPHSGEPNFTFGTQNVEKRSKKRGKVAPSLFFGGSANINERDGNKKSQSKQRPTCDISNPGILEHSSRLQRRQSAGSVASSTAKLVRDNTSLDTDDTFMDDTISCASSVASSSTSQLHGNDLYPIDCSLQLDSQVPTGVSGLGQSLSRSASFRRSLRRSINKLSSVKEEQTTGGQTTNSDINKTSAAD